jgi:flagellin-like protein
MCKQMLDTLRSDDDERGQVGIGTLIVFIALVLVAAVAAGVLIDTAGDLESRASDTGEDAQAQVSNQIDVVSATGQDSNTDDTVENVTLVVKKSPGSDPVDLSAATIEYTASDSSETLSFNASATSTEFTTAAVDGGPTQILQDTDERVQINISVSDIESGLTEGETAELQIVDQSGASTVYGVNIPDVLNSEYVEV